MLFHLFQSFNYFSQQCHLSWFTKPTEKIAIDTTLGAPSFMPDTLPVATLPIYPGLGLVCWFLPSDFLYPLWLDSVENRQLSINRRSFVYQPDVD